MDKNIILNKLLGGIVVSCQAFKEEPMYGSDTLSRMARSAELGGAVAIRANNPENIRRIKEVVNIPVFGIYKLVPKNYDKKNDVIITPNVNSAIEIYDAGSDIIAVDCTFRGGRSKEDIKKLLQEVKTRCPVLIMGEISNIEEAIFANSCGVDIISTTIAGYSPDSYLTKGPDFELIKRIREEMNTPINAEGRFECASEVQMAFNLGAWCVTVGSSITRPQYNTEKFTEEIRRKKMTNKVYEEIRELINEIEMSQERNIEVVANNVANSIELGGIVQAFGSGHSYSGALEITHRAGGFIPSKNIKEPALGAYETIPGVGEHFMKKVDIREGDIVFIISMSGRNPLSIEVALEAKKKKAKTVAVTSVKASKELTSKHKGGKNLYELCDFVLDTRVSPGDSSIEVEGLDTKVCGMSSIGNNIVLQATMLRAVEILMERDIEPPIYKSQNIEGGREFNEILEKKYIERLNRI